MKTIYKFYGDTCPPCRQLNILLDQFDFSEYKNKLDIINVEVSGNPNLVQRYGVKSIPTLLYDGNGVDVNVISINAPKTEKEIRDFFDVVLRAS